ncbi:hypothetical protein C8F01DRAFT_319568 [Mycena amicta]|nr:hypothetical protein C8F01DRAFT_319568 [Mycena amicta]
MDYFEARAQVSLSFHRFRARALATMTAGVPLALASVPAQKPTKILLPALKSLTSDDSAIIQDLILPHLQNLDIEITSKHNDLSSLISDWGCSLQFLRISTTLPAQSLTPLWLIMPTLRRLYLNGTAPSLGFAHGSDSSASTSSDLRAFAEALLVPGTLPILEELQLTLDSTIWMTSVRVVEMLQTRATAGALRVFNLVLPKIGTLESTDEFAALANEYGLAVEVKGQKGKILFPREVAV